MEVVIDHAKLLNGLTLMQGVVERRNTVPILGHVLLSVSGENLYLAATDLEVGISTETSCDARKDGKITLAARKLFEIVREAQAQEISIRSLDGDWVEVKAGRARFKMMSLDPRSFPAMPRNEKADGTKENAVKKTNGELKIAADVLGTMIDKTVFAVSPDETRYNLIGVYVEAAESGAIRMVATDGHRLALVQRDAEDFKLSSGVIIPRKGLMELRKLLDHDGAVEVSLTVEDNLAWLRTGPTEISMRLVEGEFPDYRGVIPKDSKYQVKISRDLMLAAIRRALIFANERYHGVKLTFSNGAMLISSVSAEMGEANETIDTDFTGEEFSVGFNANYLRDVLSVLSAESEIFLGLTDEVSPGVLTTPAEPGFQYVVMPMRL